MNNFIENITEYHNKYELELTLTPQARNLKVPKFVNDVTNLPGSKCLVLMASTESWEPVYVHINWDYIIGYTTRVLPPNR